MTDYLFRPKLALEIAGIDAALYNKIVADGFLPCAPSTAAGKARPFLEKDIITAFILKNELTQGRVARSAGAIACDFKNGIERYPDEDVLVLVQGLYGDRHLFSATEYKPEMAYGTGDKVYAGLYPITCETRYNIGEIRKKIAHRVEVERRTLGAPDDDE